MDCLRDLKKLTGESDEELLSLLLSMAEDSILNYTNRTVLPKTLEGTKVRWALIAYNRQGTEGEASRSAAGISQSFIEIPADIVSVLNRNRLARVGGKTYETKADES